MSRKLVYDEVFLRKSKSNLTFMYSTVIQHIHNQQNFM